MTSIGAQDRYTTNNQRESQSRKAIVMCIIAKVIAKTNKWMRVTVLTLLPMNSLSEGSLPLNNMQVISCALRSSPFRKVLKLL